MNLLVGFDPGFASCGYAVVRLLENSEEVVQLGVLRTQKSDKKRKVLSTDDNVRRARELAAPIRRLFNQPGVAAVCAESMSFPRNAGAAAKMAVTWGLLIANLDDIALPLLQGSPKEVKLAVARDAQASKEAVEAALVKRYGKSVYKLLRGVPAGQHEHAFDALAAIVGCLESDVVRMARRQSQSRMAVAG